MAEINWNAVQTKMEEFQKHTVEKCVLDLTYEELAEALSKPIYNAVNWNQSMIEAAHEKLNELSQWGLAEKLTVTARVGGKDFILELDANGEGEWVEKMENKVTVNLKVPDDFVEKVKKEFLVSYRDVVLKATKVGGLIPNSSGTIPAMLSEGTLQTQQRVQLQDKKEKIKIGGGVYFDVDGYTAKPFGQRMGTFVSLADENGYAFVQPILPHVGAAILDNIKVLTADFEEPTAGPVGVAVAPTEHRRCECDVFNFGCTCGQMDRERTSH